MSKREAVKVAAFTLLIIGTLGLLINEFILDWDRAATIIFAVFNCLGLAVLAFRIRGT
ncbi:MAG: hypothetical protein ABH839_04270 [Chloroflexota bacterium]